jgi:hypothetical protein
MLEYHLFYIVALMIYYEQYLLDLTLPYSLNLPLLPFEAIHPYRDHVFLYQLVHEEHIIEQVDMIYIIGLVEHMPASEYFFKVIDIF